MESGAKLLLREKMSRYLRPNWKRGLPCELWHNFFDNCPEPDLNAIPDQLQIDDHVVVIPGRGQVAPAQAPQGAHLCRPFNGITPGDVRVVVIGQDPYPDIAKATGRAFEDGAWDGQRTEDIAISLKPLILAALAMRDGREDLFRAGRWPVVRREIRSNHLRIPPLSEYFDGLTDQGVLFVNAAWTYTRGEDLEHHLSLWRPVMRFLLSQLIHEAPHRLVFVMFGACAQQVFAAANVEEVAQAVGRPVERIERRHLSRMPLVNNPWADVNRLLGDGGDGGIDWWPPVQ